VLVWVGRITQGKLWAKISCLATSGLLSVFVRLDIGFSAKMRVRNGEVLQLQSTHLRCQQVDLAGAPSKTPGPPR
jgi:hypothetical protein